VLIVDEAHRLTEKSGMFANRGENQIGELIRSAKACIFFLDEANVSLLRTLAESRNLSLGERGKIESPGTGARIAIPL